MYIFPLTCRCARSPVSMETSGARSADEARRDVRALKTMDPRVTRSTGARRRARGSGPRGSLRYPSCRGHRFDRRVDHIDGRNKQEFANSIGIEINRNTYP